MSNTFTPIALDNSNPNDHEVGRSEKEQDGAEELGYDDDHQTSRGEREKGDEPLGLCTKCEGIDFDVLLDPSRIADADDVFRPSKHGLLLSLGHPSDWLFETCHVCKFWYACFESVSRSDSSYRSTDCCYGLAAVMDRHRTVRGRSWYLNYAFVAVLDGPQKFLQWSSACFILEKYPRIQVHPIESLVDISIPRSWVDDCLSSHEGCKTINSTIPTREMRLINCRAGTVIEARASHKYLALSYVWGGVNQVSSQLGLVPDDLPQTVQDAIDFTLLLDRTDYLWVDSLCIDQNKDVKHDQIANMDKIYQNAMLTIIAASGENASDGLSGVSRARPKQPEIRVGSHHLISAMDRFSTVKRSAWATRGWTYQEALLSQRKLFFSREQMYYECSERCWKETLKLPESLHNASSSDQICMGVDPPMYRLTGSGVFMPEIISEYTDRIITYDSDALNACLGILQIFTRRSWPEYHFLGMPVSHEYPSEDFAATLLWEVRGSSRSCRRRQTFPSWCWTGWDTSVRFGEPIMERSDVVVSIETLDGQVLNWERALSAIKANTSNLFSSFLHLDCEIYETIFRFNGSNFVD
ncbi:hypothetical protein EG327_006119 [Venturia inaequalis]|uniref:Heterokaryon incompatibility domain-containing protein n=1 Tax=Venturia inaequalis TaxID=5025 RepID=A0A8H3V5T2_VENIN|nr:hypothetical protein EG327_006119 [Venturia inaequalis]